MITEFRDHIPSKEDFDYTIFDKIFDDFIGYCDPAEEETYPSPEAFQCLSNPAAMNAYFIWYLSHPNKFKTPLRNQNKIIEMATPDFDSPNVSRYFKNAYVDNRVKLVGTLALSENEQERAIETLSLNPELFRAFETLANMTRDYIACLEENGRESLLFDPNMVNSVKVTFNTGVRALYNGLNTRSMYTELATIFGLNSSDGNTNFAASIHRAFSYPSAFSSYTLPESGVNNLTRVHITKCPFHDIAANALTSKYEVATGKNTGEKLAGGILLTIMQKYRDLDKNNFSPEPRR